MQHSNRPARPAAMHFIHAHSTFQAVVPWSARLWCSGCTTAGIRALPLSGCNRTRHTLVNAWCVGLAKARAALRQGYLECTSCHQLMADVGYGIWLMSGGPERQVAAAAAAPAAVSSSSTKRVPLRACCNHIDTVGPPALHPQPSQPLPREGRGCHRRGSHYCHGVLLRAEAAGGGTTKNPVAIVLGFKNLEIPCSWKGW
jgi:hypothetical protein